MFDKTEISLADTSSDSQDGFDYIKANDAYMTTFNEYTPDPEKMTIIKDWLKNHNEKLVVRAYGASWCGDCRIQIPRFMKIAQDLGSEYIQVGVFSQIKVKAPYDRVKGELIWKSPPAPPEAIDVKFDMFHIPAIFLFTTDGKCVGKIDEKPEHTPTLEGNMIHHLQSL